MYPWHDILNSWADGTKLHIDALGLITLLGAEEMNRSIGRLVPSAYLDYLPLLGAFIVAGNQFTEKKSGFTLYNISAGIITTELSGWFSRWLQTQDLYQARSIITWEVEKRPPRSMAFFIGFLLVGLPCNGMMIALTVLAADWWGFANVMAMVVSVVVKCVLVAQNQAGIDANISKAQEEAQRYNYRQKRAKYQDAVATLEAHGGAGEFERMTRLPVEPKDPYEIAKVIVVTEDSKVVTIAAPGCLIRYLFTTNPRIPNRHAYMVFRWIGWIAFAVHVVSIGMAALYTQICTVVVILVATVLTANKIGCDDSRVWKTFWSKLNQDKDDEDDKYTCWVSSNLKANISSYPAEYTEWNEMAQEPHTPVAMVMEEKSVGIDSKQWWRSRAVVDLESTSPRKKTLKKTKKDIIERRQDLYAWLDLSAEEDTYLTAWGLMPRNQEWVSTYLKKKMMHRKRVGGNRMEQEQKKENEQNVIEISM